MLLLFACMHRPPLRSSCCLRAGPAASAPKKIVAPLRYDQQPSVFVRMSRSLFVAVGNVWPTKIGYKTTPYKNSLGIDAKSSEYSSSVIAFYLCSNKRWPQLSHHTVFLSTDWKGSWDSAFGKLPGGELGDRWVGRPERSLVSVRRGPFCSERPDDGCPGVLLLFCCCGWSWRSRRELGRLSAPALGASFGQGKYAGSFWVVCSRDCMPFPLWQRRPV